ncbi:MAG: cytidyltransferase [Chloroflexi bacterium]|nr:MAG: cytidyltransferase [Chloroflexota bacterium]
MGELVTFEELARVSEQLKKEGKTLVQCHGVFDLLHPGHVKHLEAARRQGDVLVVTVTPDKYVNKGPGRPIFGERLRAETIAALGCVDYVAINKWPTAVESIKMLKPDVYAKGSDYSDRESDITGGITLEEEAVRSVGGRIHFTSEISFSSSELINRYLSPYPEEAREFLQGFRQRYSAEGVISKLKSLRKTRVLVIGENITDKYVYVTPLGKSPKENLIPMRYRYEESYEGGALVIAKQMREFCDVVDYQPPQPGVTKIRYIDPTFFTKIFEYQILPEKIRLELSGDAVKQFDLVVVCDFGHGLFDDELMEKVYKSNFLALNVQTNSANLGFNLITKYKRANFFCIDEPELRLAYHRKDIDIKVLSGWLGHDLGCDKGVVTLGHKGSVVYSDGQVFHIPVLSKEAKDRLGAGDAYFALASLCAFGDFPPEVIGFIGNAIAALKVGVIGNKIIDRVSLFKFITALLS